MDCLTRRLSVRPASGQAEGAVLAWTDFREIGAFSNLRPTPNSSLPPRVNSRHAAPDPNDPNGSTAVESQCVLRVGSRRSLDTDLLCQNLGKLKSASAPKPEQLAYR